MVHRRQPEPAGETAAVGRTENPEDRESAENGRPAEGSARYSGANLTEYRISQEPEQPSNPRDRHRLSFFISQPTKGLRPLREKANAIICKRGISEQTIVMPIGIIEGPAPAGAVFRLTPQGQRAGLKTDTQVTIWRYHPEQLAMAKYAGRITQVSDETATFSILRAEVDERWPQKSTLWTPEPLCT